MDNRVVSTIIIFLLIALSIFLGSLISLGKALYLFIVIAAIGVVIVTFIQPTFGLAIFIFSMLLSPEIKLAEVPSRAVVVRVDDIVLLVVFFTWLAKMAINKELGLIRPTPINKPIIWYIMAGIILTLKGVLFGLVNLRESLFYLLKYIEYFMIFFIFSNEIREMKQCRLFMACFFITAILAAGYGYLQLGGGERITAPFEGQAGEPNTLGGYLLLVMAIAAGLILYEGGAKKFLFYAGLIVFLFIPFLYALSRASYLAFVPMSLTLLIFTHRRKGIVFVALIIAIILSPSFLPEKVKNRISTIFHGESEQKILGITTHHDLSAAARIESWKRILFNKWPERPFTGWGITGVGLVDSQYPRILGELGIIGLGIFIWIITLIFKQAWRLYSSPLADNYIKGFSLGYLAGLAGLLVHGLGAETFIIVRIMEPFWFLTAVLLSMQIITGSETGRQFKDILK